MKIIWFEREDKDPGGRNLDKLLCFLGMHKWNSVIFRFSSWFECERCGKRKKKNPRVFIKDL